MAKFENLEIDDVPAPEVVADRGPRLLPVLGCLSIVVLLAFLVAVAGGVIWYSNIRDRAVSDVTQARDEFREVLAQPIPDELKGERLNEIARARDIDMFWFNISPGGEFLVKRASSGTFRTEEDIAAFVKQSVGPKTALGFTFNLGEAKKMQSGVRGEEINQHVFTLHYFITKYDDKSIDGVIVLKKFLNIDYE